MALLLISLAHKNDLSHFVRSVDSSKSVNYSVSVAAFHLLQVSCTNEKPYRGSHCLPLMSEPLDWIRKVPRNPYCGVKKTAGTDISSCM